MTSNYRVKVETYSIGVSHEAFGVEGGRTITGTAAEAITAARQLASESGHGWRPFVLDAAGHKVTEQPS